MGIFDIFKKKDDDIFSADNFGSADSGLNNMSQPGDSGQGLNSPQQGFSQPQQFNTPQDQFSSDQSSVPDSSLQRPAIRQLNASFQQTQFRQPPSDGIGKYDIQLIQKDVSLILETLNGIRLVLNDLDKRIKKLEDIAENEQNEKNKKWY